MTGSRTVTITADWRTVDWLREQYDESRDAWFKDTADVIEAQMGPRPVACAGRANWCTAHDARWPDLADHCEAAS